MVSTFDAIDAELDRAHAENKQLADRLRAAEARIEALETARRITARLLISGSRPHRIEG